MGVWWKGRIKRDYFKFCVIQENLSYLPVAVAFLVLCKCLPGAQSSVCAAVPVQCVTELPSSPLSASCRTAMFS